MPRSPAAVSAPCTIATGNCSAVQAAGRGESACAAVDLSRKDDGSADSYQTLRSVAPEPDGEDRCAVPVGVANSPRKLSALPIAHCSVNCIIKRPSSCRAAASALRRTSARSKPSVCYEEAQAAPGVLPPGQLCAYHCCMLGPLLTSPCSPCRRTPTLS